MPPHPPSRYADHDPHGRDHGGRPAGRGRPQRDCGPALALWLLQVTTPPHCPCRVAPSLAVRAPVPLAPPLATRPPPPPPTHPTVPPPRRTAVVGLALFTQYWYWYPLSYCASLALQPTALVGVDATLRAPKDFYVRAPCPCPCLPAHALPATRRLPACLPMRCAQHAARAARTHRLAALPPCTQVVSACRPSLYAYPPPVKVEDKKQRGKVSECAAASLGGARLPLPPCLARASLAWLTGGRTRSHAPSAAAAAHRRAFYHRARQGARGAQEGGGCKGGAGVCQGGCRQGRHGD